MKFNQSQFHDANGTNWRVGNCTMHTIAGIDYMGRMFQRLVAVQRRDKQFLWIHKDFLK